MYKITFESRPSVNKTKWEKTTCLIKSIDECIEKYGLSLCDFHIISIENVLDF